MCIGLLILLFLFWLFSQMGRGGGGGGFYRAAVPVPGVADFLPAASLPIEAEAASRACAVAAAAVVLDVPIK
jgi:hypothetical protein